MCQNLTTMVRSVWFWPCLTNVHVKSALILFNCHCRLQYWSVPCLWQINAMLISMTFGAHHYWANGNSWYWKVKWNLSKLYEQLSTFLTDTTWFCNRATWLQRCKSVGLVNVYFAIVADHKLSRSLWSWLTLLEGKKTIEALAGIKGYTPRRW